MGNSGPLGTQGNQGDQGSTGPIGVTGVMGGPLPMGVSGLYSSSINTYIGTARNTFIITTTVPNASNFWLNGFKWSNAARGNYPRIIEFYAATGSTYWMIFGTFYFPTGPPGTVSGSNLTYYYEYM
jgi:hypothetical protein